MRKQWKRGIGNDCRKVYDGDGHLVCEVIRPEDGTLIVDVMNEGTISELEQQLADARELAEMVIESIGYEHTGKYDNCDECKLYQCALALRGEAQG